MDVEEEDDECVPEVTKQKKKRGRGSAGRALETANVLDSMLEDTSHMSFRPPRRSRTLGGSTRWVAEPT